jgi:uncharacterized protein (DUF1015 family)
MPRVSPFVGLRFDRSRVGSLERVTAPPYDVISTEEHARYLAASPYNVIGLDLGRVPGVEGGDERYARAGEDLASWRREGILVPAGSDAYYAYEMRFSLHGRRRRIRGLVCAVELQDWGGDVVAHERTMPGPIEDRLRLVRATTTNLSSIYAVFLGPVESVASWLDRQTAHEPDASMTDEDGVEHRLWETPPEADVAAWLDGPSLMIADGHHRYATALRYRDEQRARHGAGPWDATMMFLVDAAIEDPPVLPYHRIQLGGPVPGGGERVRDLEEVLESVDDGSGRLGLVTHDEGALVHRLIELPGGPPTVCRLHELDLAGLDGDLRYTPDAVAAEETVRAGEAVAAYFLPATDALTIRSVVDAGGRLPQKSTFFWPKPRTGMVLRPHGV